MTPRLVFTACLCLLASACSTPPADVDPSQQEREVVFDCSPGEPLAVRFIPARNAAVLLRNGNAVELLQQPSGSGFVYSNGPNTIRGKGRDLTVEIGRMVPMQCRAR